MRLQNGTGNEMGKENDEEKRIPDMGGKRFMDEVFEFFVLMPFIGIDNQTDSFKSKK